MNTSLHNESHDRETDKLAANSTAFAGKAEMATRCRLCREMIVLETNFRPTTVICSHCGLKFAFDPQHEPLPVRGLRLRYSDVLDAQRRTGIVHHKRHDAHIQQAVQLPLVKTNYLAWAGGLALSLAAAIAFFSVWGQRFLGR